jgi:hypothetical protein
VFAQSEPDQAQVVADIAKQMTENQQSALLAVALAEEKYFGKYSKYTDSYDDLKEFELIINEYIDYSEITLFQTPFQGYPAYRFSVIDKLRTICQTYDSSLERNINKASYY